MARCVPVRNVADFVAEYAGELVLAVDEGEQPARDVDRAAWERERVGFFHVDHMEAVVHARWSVARDSLAHRRHPGCRGGVVR